MTLSARRSAHSSTLTAYGIGDVVEGTVSHVSPYGAFIAIDDDVTGLLHISQISHDRVADIDGLVAVGDRMKVSCLPGLCIENAFRRKSGRV